MTGTSQATAFVSGAAALVMAHKMSFQAIDVKKYILSTGDAMTSLAAKTRTSRQLNMFKALTILDEGVGASGVIAVRNEEFFGSDPNAKNPDPDAKRKVSEERSVTRFGKSLLDAIEKNDRKAKPNKLPSKLGGGKPDPTEL
jgi:hypothetical protein